MLGFHRHTRSLISVKLLSDYETVHSTQDTDVAPDARAAEAEVSGRLVAKTRKQLVLVYVLFLAEAVMTSSLQPQLNMLFSSHHLCPTLPATYIRGLLECSYAFGSTAGMSWGYLADRIGRRPLALAGLYAMVLCCTTMGFATDLISCVVFRFLAGLASSAVVVSTLAMIGDLSSSPNERTTMLAGLPLVSVCGSIGPLIHDLVWDNVKASGALWRRYPSLSSQVTCGSLISVIAMLISAALAETLPMQAGACDPDEQSEKTAFLSADKSDDGPLVQVVDSVRLEPMSVSYFIQSPSFLVLLATLCLLSLHSGAFEVLLPHLGNSNAQLGSVGISCLWLGLTELLMRAVAGMMIAHLIPRAVTRLGLLTPHRTLSGFLPLLYAAVPVLLMATSQSAGAATVVWSAAIVVKHCLVGGAWVMVWVVVLNTTPDAFSVGTAVGLMQVASLFRALAAAISGASLYFSDGTSVATAARALWASLGLLGVAMAALAWFVRETPSVERDFPSEALCWENVFDAERGAIV